MKNRLLLLVVVLTCSSAQAAEETLYAGKPLAFWLKRLESDDVLMREEALVVLTEAGPTAREAVPLVEKLLHSEPLMLRTRAALAWRRLTGDGKPAVAALIDNLKAESVPQRLEALRLLEPLVADAGAATPLLLEQLDHADRRLRVPANQLLIRLGRTAVHGLSEALDGSLVRRRAAAEILAHLGPSGHAAIPALRRRLSDTDEEVRRNCACALWVMGQTDEVVAVVLAEGFPARNVATGRAILFNLDQAPYRPRTAIAILTAALRDDNPANRVLAANLLWEIEGRSETVLPVYRAALSDRSAPIRQQAARGLARLGRAAQPMLSLLLEELQKSRGSDPGLNEAIVAIGPDAVTPLVELLDGRRANPASAAHAAMLLGRLGRPAAEKVTPLLDREDNALRLNVCQILFSVGPASRGAVPRLKKLLADKDGRIRQRAAAALGEIGPDAGEAAPALIEMARDTNLSMRLAAVTALEKLHAPAEIVRPAALTALKDTNALIRAWGLRLLRQADPKHRDLVPQALKLLDEPSTRIEAASILESMGADAAAAVRELVKRSQDGERAQRFAILQVLGRIGPPAHAAKPALLKLIEGPDPDLRLAALRALRDMRPGDRTLTPHLVALLKDNTARYGQPALQLLSDLGPAAVEAVPWLVEELHRPQSPCRMEAAEALAKIDPDRARQEATPILRGLLHDLQKRIAAAVLLQQLHLEDTEGVAALVDILREPNPLVRRAAAEALGQLGAAARSAARPLRESLHDPSGSVRCYAATALWRVTGKTDMALPVLREILRTDPSRPELGEAVVQLGQMGRAARAALPELRQAQDDCSSRVRAQIAAAIRKIDVPAKPEDKR